MVVRGVCPLYVIETAELSLGRNRGLKGSWSITPPDLDVRVIQVSSYGLATKR